MYGEPSHAWISLLDAVRDYNDPQGSLSAACHPGGSPAPGTDPMSIVYQVAICGPDPRTLEVNGEFPSTGIDGVKCHQLNTTPAQESSFKASVDAELVKLGEILRYQRSSFRDNVKLVLVGNEILFSRGICQGDPSKACTQNDECASNQCEIGHFCSDTLSQLTPTMCAADSDCTAPARCTDVTNAKAILYAFQQVQSLLEHELGSTAVPPMSISIQGNILTAPSLGNTNLPLWSREQFVDSLPNKIVTVNIYPDQWGLVPKGSYPASDPACMHATLSSCLDASNSVEGNKTSLRPACTESADQYVNPLTDSLRNSIHDFYKTLKMYYPGFDIVIAETGWHTDGACLGYNDCKPDASRYSPGEAAKYYASLYQYVKTNQIPLLSFELFDQKTKLCDTATGVPGAEANYGIFQHYCQLKGNLPGLLPSNGPYAPDLAGFDRFLENGSCENQTVWSVHGVGNLGVCSNNTTLSCQNSVVDCGAGNRCVWGHCENDGTQGCNPGDPDNPAGCGTCFRAGNCYAPVNPVGYFASKPLAACWPGQACPDVCPDFKGNFNQPCKCYVAMAPATLSGFPQVEGPDFTMKWSYGAVELEKPVTPIASVVPGSDGFFVQPVWGRAFVGAGWDTKLIPKSTDHSYPVCPNHVNSVTPGHSTKASITWKDSWGLCHYPPGDEVRDTPNGLDVAVVRTTGGPVSTFPRVFTGPGGTPSPILVNTVGVVACDMVTDIQALIDDAGTPDKALKPLNKALAKVDAACGAENTKASIKAVKKSVSFLEKAAKKGADVALEVARLVSSVRFAATATIEAAIAEVGTDDKKVTRAQEHFDKAQTKQDPRRAVRLFKRAHTKADKAVSK